MLQQQEYRVCLLCKKTIKGRSDKKFCDDYCRASFNNELKSAANNHVRNINNALGRNRRLLENLFTTGELTIKINQEKLLEHGFLFKYHTHQYHTLSGNTYFFCYEYGYLPLENNWYLVVKRTED